MTEVLSSFAVPVVMFCDVRVNTRDKTIKVEVRIRVVETGDFSKHKSMLVCCIFACIRMAISQGFTPHNVAHILGNDVKALHVKYCLHVRGVMQQWLSMTFSVCWQVLKTAI